MSGEKNVVVPRWALAALAALCVVAVVTVAFLLGRESAGNRAEVVVVPTAPAPVSRPVAPAPAAATAPDGEPPAPARHANPQTDISVVSHASPAPRAADPVPAAPAVPFSNRSAADDLRARVAAYFIETETIMASAKSWDDPATFAMQVLQGAVQGDSQSLEQVERSMRNVQEKLRTLSVPAECTEHHTLTVATVSSGIDVLRGLRSSLTAGTKGLSKLSTAGEKVKQDSARADELARQIKKRYEIH